jgi:hypothetical protein
MVWRYRIGARILDFGMPADERRTYPPVLSADDP